MDEEELKMMSGLARGCHFAACLHKSLAVDEHDMELVLNFINRTKVFTLHCSLTKAGENDIL